MSAGYPPSLATAFFGFALLIAIIAFPARAQEVAPSPSPIEQAQELRWKHQYRKAIELLLQALQDKPQDPELMGQLAKVYEQWDKIKQAISYFEQAVKLDPASAERWKDLGNIYRRSGDNDKAYSAYRQVLELAPDQSSAYQPMVYFLSGTRRKPADALLVLDKGLKVVKDKESLYRMRGDILESMGQHQQAIEALQMAIQANPDRASWTQDSIGRLYVKLGEFDKAWQSLQMAYQGQESAEYKAWLAYGGALGTEYRISRARQAYEKATAVSPKEYEAYERLGRLLAEQEDFQAAEAVLNRGLQNASDKASLYSSLADLYMKQKRYQEARQIYEKMIAADPQAGHLYQYLGAALLQLGLQKEALAAFRRAEKDKEDPEAAAYVQLANTFQMASFGELGDVDSDARAAAYLELALRRRGQDADLWRSLASTYLRQGQYDKAMAAYRKYYQINEDPAGEALTVLEVAGNRLGNLGGRDRARGILLMSFFAQVVPDGMLQSFREEPEMVRFFARMLERSQDEKETRQDVLQELEQQVNSAIAQIPDNGDLLNLLGDVQFYLGQPDSALATWEKAAKLNRKSNPRAWALNLRANKQAEEMLEALAREVAPLWEEIQKYPDLVAGKMEKVPPALAEFLATRWPAIKRRIQEPVARARYDVVRALQMQPGEADLHISLARIDGWIERWDDALRSIQRALKLAPDTAEYYKMLYGIQLIRGDKRAAVRALEEGAARSGDDYQLRYKLIQVYMQAGERASAVRVIEDICRRSSYFRRQLTRDKQYEPLLSEPRIKALLD